MSFTIIALTALVFIIIYQIAKASEYATILRGEEKVKADTNKLMAWLLLLMFVLGMWGLWACHKGLMTMMMPESGSVQGVEYDSMLLVTTIVTGVVFFVTQTLLFWFAFRYQASEKRKAYFLAHNNSLEILWTTVPAIAMTVLVVIGLRNWNMFTSAAPSNAQVVEVVGKQFNWLVRYPGKDGVLGKRDFREISDKNNVLGLLWDKKENLDDVILENGEIHLVKNKPVKFIIGSRDVIHDVGLPHFRFKMDAVPGITTTLWFTPRFSTEEMKQKTGNPNFVYELSCDQMCGKGHYSMRGTIIVHENQKEFDAWMSKQASYYTLNFATPAAAPAAEVAAPANTNDTTKSTANATVAAAH